MPFIAFLQANHERIVSEFATFAKILMPPGADISGRELRDHADEMLTAIAVDMELSQSRDEQASKSQGRGAARTMAASRSV